MKLLVSLVFLVMITSCTQFKVTREYHLNQGNGQGSEGVCDNSLPPINVMVLNLKADVATETSAEQSASFESRLVAALKGSTANAVEDGMQEGFKAISRYVENRETKREAKVEEKAKEKVNYPIEPVTITNNPPSKTLVSPDTVERGKFSKRHPTNNRPYWYFKKPMKDYPSDFDIVVKDCGTVKVRGNTGARIDWDESLKVVPFNESRNRWFLRQSTIPSDPRNMVLVAPQGCMASEDNESAYIITTAAPQVKFTPYHIDKYEDGRWRYLFRTTMEELPDTFYVVYEDEVLYTIDKKSSKYMQTNPISEGERWEYTDRFGSVLKNTHGRAENVTLLLISTLVKGQVALAY